ncbi:Na(+)/citrate cotransporter-like [Leucoraja erinacea]|uniref:Na(+)/citrate cotransporter-like n=1 Tax=Leucoraja erinaceus TaxID=7782 RepID=UPI0024544105|nr:Na(+)/citrate cotransporter-like [Leucoraja erinacea]
MSAPNKIDTKLNGPRLVVSRLYSRSASVQGMERAGGIDLRDVAAPRYQGLDREAYFAFIVMLMAVYWSTEVIPPPVIAIFPVVLFPMFGIMTSKEVCKQYMKDTSMLFLGGLMVAVAVETCNLHKRIALRALLLIGVQPALLMMGFMGVTAFLSMWISDTATAAMMVPITQAVLDLLSTTTTQPGDPEQGHGQTTGEQQLEEKDATDEENQPALISPVVQTQDAEVEIRVSVVPHSDEQSEQSRVQKMLSLCVCYSASIGGTATLTGPSQVLKGLLSQIFPDNGDVINFASWFGFSFPNMLIMLTCCWLWLHLLFLGVNFQRLRSCRRKNSPIEQAAYGIIQGEYRKLGLMSFAEKLVLGLVILLITLWFTREPGFVPGWGSLLNIEGKKFVTNATVGMFITVLMFIIPSHRPRLKGWAWNKAIAAEPGQCLPEDVIGSTVPRGPSVHQFVLWPQCVEVQRLVSLSSGPRVVLPSSTGIDSREQKDHRSGRLLEWKEVQRKLPWNVVLLMGGGFALVQGCEVSGLHVWMGRQLLPLKNLPPWSIAALLCLLISIFTECSSNVATATLFLPMLASMVVLFKLNPLYVMIPCTVSTSFAFMLPVATPPNAIVFSYGHVRVSDMVKAGFVLKVISVVSVTVAINTWGRAMFHIDTFPAWANISRSP